MNELAAFSPVSVFPVAPAPELQAALAALTQRGAQFQLAGERVQIYAPPGVLTPQLKTLLAEHKPALQAWLRHAQTASASMPAPAPAPAPQPFPLTDTQQAYLAGRAPDFPLGGVGCHVYYEIEAHALDLPRLERAWQQLIERHPLLRTVVTPDGQQCELTPAPVYRIAQHDLRQAAPDFITAELAARRARMEQQVHPAERWPLFELCATQLPDDRTRLHCSFDLLMVDALSLRLLFTEWQQLYEAETAAGGLPPLTYTFRDYVLAEATAPATRAARQRDEAFWRLRLADLPPAPELPLAGHPAQLTPPRFVRLRGEFPATDWQRLKAHAAARGLTPSVVLLTAYAEVLATWSKAPRFSLNLTLLNRQPHHPQVNALVGDFTSFVPLAVDHSPDHKSDNFTARAQRLQATLCAAVEHSQFSGARLLREWAQRSGQPAGHGLPVVFTSLLGQEQRSAAHPLAWLGTAIYGISQTPQVWLDHQVMELGGALWFHWDAVAGLFPPQMLEAMFAAYSELLRQLSQASVWEEPHLCLTPPEQLAQRAAVNATAAPVSAALLHELFLAQAARQPQHCALRTPQRAFSYDELRRRSTALAAHLRAAGLQPNELVAIVMEKGWEQVVAALAVLQAGGAYLPLDVALPAARLTQLLADAQTRWALTQSFTESQHDAHWPDAVQRLAVDTWEDTDAALPALPSVQTPTDLAYVIYTSGSTGTPKGVMIDQRGAVNTVLDINERLGLHAADRVLALSSLSFDLSVYDLFGTLAAGATIVLPDAAQVRDPARLADWLAREPVTVWNSVPALLSLLIEYLENHAAELPANLSASLRAVLLSGDWIPVDLPERVRRRGSPAKLYSLGGATEASIWSIWHPIETVDPTARSIPYGRPLRNQTFAVLNSRWQPCPVWTPGELYIGGLGLAQGYWRDEAKTRARFVTHPLTGARLYRTGDLGRYLPDGSLEFLGREDGQVKLNGFRVEVGEIEAALLQHPQITAAAVVVQRGAPPRLAAFFVAATALLPAEVRAFLSARLPGYLVPTRFTQLPELPLTANGKIERAALATREVAEPASAARPFTQTQTTETQTSADTNMTAQLTRIVAETLQCATLAPEQNLFELGADSLTVIRLLNRLERELRFRPAIEDFYARPSVAALIQAYQTAGTPQPAPT